MFNKKIVLSFFIIVCGCCLSSWILPTVSRQQQVPENYVQGLADLKKREKVEKQLKKQEKAALQEKYQFAYLAHQKNRLDYFAQQDGFIWFDKGNKYTYFLSNSYPAKIKMWSMKFICAEGAFQAAKFLHNPEVAVRFTHLEGKEALKLAQNLSYQQRGDWYQVRENIMKEVLHAKFQQHSDLAELLLATGDAYLVEHNATDAFWTDGYDGCGKNRLGRLLMQVRGEMGGIGIVSKPSTYKKFAQQQTY